MNSLWYGGGVVNVRYKGYTYHIEAIGDVYANLSSVCDDHHLCYIKDKNNNGNFGSEIIDYIRSDKTLEDALGASPRRYRLYMENSNWWECFVTDPQGEFHDLMLNLDADKLFDAIADVLTNLDEIIKYMED
jgi:hypothetical protein